VIFPEIASALGEALLPPPAAPAALPAALTMEPSSWNVAATFGLGLGKGDSALGVEVGVVPVPAQAAANIKTNTSRATNLLLINTPPDN